MNIFCGNTDSNKFFFDSKEGIHPFLSFKRLLIKHALRSHCILDSLCSIIHSPPYSQIELPYHTRYWSVYCCGPFVLRKICSYAQAGGRSEPLDKKRNDILNIKKEKLPSFDTIRAELSRIRRSDKFLIRKTGIGQLASLPDKSETICLSAADTYWTAFMLHNHRSISQYEKSLDNFISSQHNYPAYIIEFLKDLISVEHSFESNLPDALVTPKNPDKIFSGKLEEYKSCDFLLNYIKLEQTFCLQYYIDILVLLHDKNPELCSSVQVLNPGEKIRKYTDTKTPCIRQLEELPETYFIKLCSYLNDMPNVFSRTLFLSYAFDCYYTLEHSEHNYTSEPAIQTSIIMSRTFMLLILIT